MLPQGSKKQKTISKKKKQKTAADAPNLAALPPDILAKVLLCVPASDLRRFRGVCKAWRDFISDPRFIDLHMVHRPRAPTHTIVFYPGRCRPADGAHESLNGGGFLFDEQWSLTARFTVDESAEMIGTCKGLLCFRNSVDGVIKVVEPLTGDSIALPLPPMAPEVETCNTAAYCFGFDATARRYKVVHSLFEGKVDYDGYFFRPSMKSTVKQELHVYTIGEDKEWRTVGIHGAQHGVLYGDPACDDGAVYWYSQGHHDGHSRNVRFDLATEEVTSEPRRLVRGAVSCRYLPLLCQMHAIGIRSFGELNMEDGCWSTHVDAAAHEAYDVAQWTGCRLAGPHALQRGHLLLRWHKDGALRAHQIVKSGVSTLDFGYHWDSKTLIQIGSVEEEELTERYRFFRVRRHDPSEVEVPMIGRLPSKARAITTFAYVPTLSPASLV